MDEKLALLPKCEDCEGPCGYSVDIGDFVCNICRKVHDWTAERNNRLLRFLEACG